MERLKTYDYITRSRRRVFDWVRPLGAQDYAREFMPGQRTLGQTLTHIMIVEWANLQMIQGKAPPPYEQWPIQEEAAPPFAALETLWNEQAVRGLETLRAVRDWTVEFEFNVVDDNGRAVISTASVSDIFTHMVLHEVYHRGQVSSLLRRLGVSVEDNDFNTLMYRRRAATPA